MEAGGKRDYTIVPESQIAADLDCCVRTIRASVKRLVAEQLIERQDTPGNTRSRMLVYVQGGQIVDRPKRFPTVTRRLRQPKVVTAPTETTAVLRTTHTDGEDEESPF